MFEKLNSVTRTVGIEKIVEAMLFRLILVIMFMSLPSFHLIKSYSL